MTPEEYFKYVGIDFNQTTTLSVVDGYLRQVDIVYHMNEFLRLNKILDSQIVKPQSIH